MKPLGKVTFQTERNTNTRNKRAHAIRCADQQNANCRCGSAKCYAFGAPDCIRKSLRPEINRYTKQFSTKTMQIYRYHGDTDETPTVDAGNLSVSWMVGTPAVSVVLTRSALSFVDSIRPPLSKVALRRFLEWLRTRSADVPRLDASCLRKRPNKGTLSATKGPYFWHSTSNRPPGANPKIECSF